jgi:hypothetical protein
MTSPGHGEVSVDVCALYYSPKTSKRKIVKAFGFAVSKKKIKY